MRKLKQQQAERMRMVLDLYSSRQFTDSKLLAKVRGGGTGRRSNCPDGPDFFQRLSEGGRDDLVRA